MKLRLGISMRWAAAAIAALFAATILNPVAVQAAPLNLNAPNEYALVTCASASELDCVESFGFLNKANEYIEAKLVETIQQPGYVSEIGNQVQQGYTSWSAQVDGVEQSANLLVPLQSPKYRLWKNPDGTYHFGSSLRPWVTSDDLLNTKVRFVIRTSFLKPQNIQLVAGESDFAHKVIRGGNSWTFEGKGTPVSIYYDWSKVNPDKDPADEDTSTLHFIIHHADANLAHGYWPAPCASKGYSVQAFNSNSAGEPRWNVGSNSLDFAIQSTHLMSTGAPNVGFFKLWTTDAYMNCQWPGNTLATSNNLTVQVINTDGTKQVATSQVAHANGKLFVEATGFHYSKPTIKIVDASRPPKKVIICVKKTNAKSLKKVVAVAPKCPSGYKLKK
jgi:hypothetical protein